jgi:hypothetical protein
MRFLRINFFQLLVEFQTFEAVKAL